jgi:TPP-dependent pyruvate/acetoin dehydrogenase alpha subunit
MVQFGDGATSTGEFHAGLNFAGVFRAPTVFLCVNNQYATSVPFARQTAASSVAIKAGAYGIDGIRVDGNDALAVYQVAKSAVDRAQRGNGPTLVECYTYRVDAHSTSDDPQRYQSAEEVHEWRTRKDPIERLRRFLIGQGKGWTEKADAGLRRQLEARVLAAIREAEALPPPDRVTLFRDVYTVPPWHLNEQASQVGLS